LSEIVNLLNGISQLKKITKI